ncbi:PH domain-containing protein [Cryptosporidium felis]|nr:PH domain-containing protein [Cryptosporidium felis]
MGDYYQPSTSRTGFVERSASRVQELIEKEYVSGYLKKWSPVIGRGWQNRYFALLEQDKSLVYWAKKPSFRDEQPRGSINLKIVENVFADGPLGITLSTPNRDYQLKASSPTEKDKWMDAIILWTLKSRKYRSKAEDSKNFRFSNMLMEATQSCLHYIVESFLKPYKKSATRAPEVGPETLSNSNKKKFLKDRGLYNVICKAWMISRDLKEERDGSMRKTSLGCIKDVLETRTMPPLLADRDFDYVRDRHTTQQLCDEVLLRNSSHSHPRFGVTTPTPSLEGSENSRDSEVFCSLAEIEDVAMGYDSDEILLPLDSELCIYDRDCPPTVEEDEKYVRHKQHKYSIQLSDLMLSQLSNLPKESFLENCIFGLIYIRRSNPVSPALQSNGIFWALMISSRSLADSHQIYPSPILGERTILGDCLSLFREVRLPISSSRLSNASNSKPAMNPGYSSREDSVPVLGAVQNSQISKSSLEGTLDTNDPNFKSNLRPLDHKTEIDDTLIPPIGGELLGSFPFYYGSGKNHFRSNSQPIDPYGFLLDTLYLYQPKNESKNPVHMLDPRFILSVGPISESPRGFSFTLSYLGVSVVEDYIACDLELNCDFPSAIPSPIGLDAESIQKRPIKIEFCTRSWRDARAWRYSLIVARKSKIVENAQRESPTVNSYECKFACGHSKHMHDYMSAKGGNYSYFDSCPTLTTTASSSARTSHGYHLTNYRRNISNFTLNR